MADPKATILHTVLYGQRSLICACGHQICPRVDALLVAILDALDGWTLVPADEITSHRECTDSIAALDHAKEVVG